MLSHRWQTLRWFLLIFCLALISGPAVWGQQAEPAGDSRILDTVVDATTLTGKVMCGYQGWFSCPDDGGQLGWTHWARTNRQPFGPGNVTVDLWPDVRELSPQERFRTRFNH